ncbi:cilia- and flagella-associated protein 91 isoform X2 [Orussus abietinus]|uniref:cilia- and flagella-associated protein 91 isoform X2 n=1 Tax=Orussus abietinus TaxID=222816 RepID=UPI000625B259|nr:cilia- and flagella-associated protein 91 isoform X2 [Orussus abietinus]
MLYRRPIVPFVRSSSPAMEPLTLTDGSALKDVIQSAQRQSYAVPPLVEKIQNKETQTDYRESECQTLPWEPPYRIHPGHNPEVLSVAHLTWGHGLPAGMHEVEIINRLRMKRAWEAILPPMDTPENIKTRSLIISALEADEWAFREAEIQFIMDMRMNLMEKLIKERDEERDRIMKNRFEKVGDFLRNRRDKEIMGIRRKLGRELRKLAVKHRGQNVRYQKRDIVKQHADRKSELYAPQLRFGESAQRRHEIIRKRLLRDTYVEAAEKIDTKPSGLLTYEELKAFKIKSKPAELCVRETRWTEGKLRQLHADLKAIRLNLKPSEEINLLQSKCKEPTLPQTPIKARTHDFDNEVERSTEFIQKTVRGRAIQCMMFEGRNRCRELIEELQSTTALQKHSKKLRQQEKDKMLSIQQEQNYSMLRENRLSEILNSLEGMTVCGILDYLSKELIRLKDERTAHAFALLAERIRYRREAAEAGRRQLERNRRRELDEMFRQIVKVNQESVETYLEDIIKESIDWISDKEAKEYIETLVAKAEKVSDYAVDNAAELAEQEMVADMVYNFVLPEVEKQIIRENMKQRQQSYLQNAHAAIYNEILNLDHEEPLTPSDVFPDKSNVETDAEEERSLNENYMIEIETNTAWKGDTVEKHMDPVKAIANYILQTIISRVIPSKSEEMVHELLEDVLSEVVKSNKPHVLRDKSSKLSWSSSYTSHTNSSRSTT